MDPVIAETVDFLRPLCRRPPVFGLILGSGLGAYADSLENRTAHPYSHIPHFPNASVSGHSGHLVIGEVKGIPCIALRGRIHFYEAYSMRDIAIPIRILKGLGVSCLIVTNAAGGLNPEFSPGDLMMIEDHINLMGSNPLIGPGPEESVDRFTDMSKAYDPVMRAKAVDTANQLNMVLRRGIYLAVTGPCYETPAEIRMYRSFGADAVGMSTVPEVIAAVHLGIRVLGISCITNMAAGMGSGKIKHDEVLETTQKAEGPFRALLDGIIEAVGSGQ